MVKNTLLMTTVIFLGLAFFLMDGCQFLIPYRHLLWAKYGRTIAVFAVALLGISLQLYM